MNSPAPAIDPLEVFELRAWARARLYAENLLELGEAVDVLQEAAEQSGLVRAIGVTGVQDILAAAFEEAR
ncbi:MAG TPA: hypothetical protein VIJ35_09095 [Bradyrhizobium sp.]